MRVSSEVLKCIAYVGLETNRSNNSVTMNTLGTGFYVRRDEYGLPFVYLVTARHVIEKHPLKQIVVRMTKHDGTAVIPPLSGDWKYHPDPTVDVAVLGWAPARSDFDYLNLNTNAFCPR